LRKVEVSIRERVWLENSLSQGIRGITQKKTYNID
jgi:hypothetical protein